MTIWKAMRPISIYLPEELLLEMDEAGKQFYINRSEYIRYVLLADAKKRGWPGTGKVQRQNPLDPRIIDVDDS